MIRFPTYRFTDPALAQARSLGIYGNTAERLTRMLKRAAPLTSPLGDRRFQEFAFKLQDDLVVWVERLEMADQAA